MWNYETNIPTKYNTIFTTKVTDGDAVEGKQIQRKQVLGKYCDGTNSVDGIFAYN